LKKRTVKQQIKLLGTIVKSIETLRSKLLVKILPPLLQEGYARTIYCGDTVWVLATEDTEFLDEVDWMEQDNNAEIGDHVKFYDINDNLILPVPDDYVAMYTQNPSPNTSGDGSNR
jgi:hypothetical protein